MLMRVRVTRVLLNLMRSKCYCMLAFWFVLNTFGVHYSKAGYNYDDRFKIVLDTVNINGDSIRTFWKENAFGGAGKLSFGLGHHDNLSIGGPVGQTKLATGELYWHLYAESGVRYKSSHFVLLFGYMQPIPHTVTKNSYTHSTDQIYYGLLLRHRLLSRRQRINFSPFAGFKIMSEEVHIEDPEGKNPPLLEITYTKNAPFYGLELSYIFSKNSRVAKELSIDYKFIFSYSRENLRNSMDKFRVEYAISLYPVPQSYSSSEKSSFFEVGYLSLGLEHVRGLAGRKDWFFIIILGAD